MSDFFVDTVEFTDGSDLFTVRGYQDVKYGKTYVEWQWSDERLLIPWHIIKIINTTTEAAK